MNLSKLENEIATLVSQKKIKDAIALIEEEFSKIRDTDFHKIIGRNLLHLKDELNLYLTGAFKASQNSLDNKTKAIYCEMNGFTINYDLWFILSFSFKFSHDIDNADWLDDYDFFYEMALTISGFEDIQETYKDYMQNERWEEDKELEDASDICALLITLKLQELFQFTFEESNNSEEWKKVPLFVTSHDYESIYQTF